MALLSGALRVVCIGAPEHACSAVSVGAADVLNIESASESERLGMVRERTEGRGADVTIEATGAPVAVIQAMRFTRDAAAW